MKNILKTQITVLALFLLFPMITNATISTNINPTTDKTLVLSKEGNNTIISNEALEKQTFRVGSEISYQLTHNQEIQKGQIVGFSDEEIIVENQFGEESTIQLKDLAKIRKRSNADKIAKGIQIASAILGTLTGLGAMDSFNKSDELINTTDTGLGFLFFIPAGMAFAAVGFVLLLLTALFAITFGVIFLVRRIKNPTFRIKGNWKMKIQ